MDIGKKIIEIAIENGATLAGIASMEAVKASPSHAIYQKMGSYSGVGTVDTPSGNQLFNWPEQAKSVLVIALSHPQNRPELDWWDGRGTPGNRMLIQILAATTLRIQEDLDLTTHKLHYYVERGGLFLKDAAVLAGLGCIGKNNLLVTPDYGPRVRLRGLLLDARLDPTGPIDFDPCADCEVYCRKVCPEKALDRKSPVFESMDGSTPLPARDGAYQREICNIRMEKDISESEQSHTVGAPVKYCRQCEMVCPVGRRT
jgi:epoxyqueuosine reductase